MGYIRCKRGESVIVPQFEHCFCNALFDYAGEHKYKIACAFEKGAEGLRALEKIGVSPKFFPAPIEELLLLHKEHPELTFGSNYHFTEFKELTGALHIIGMSPNNDSQHHPHFLQVMLCFKDTSFSPMLCHFTNFIIGSYSNPTWLDLYTMRIPMTMSLFFKKIHLLPIHSTSNIIHLVLLTFKKIYC